MKKLGIVLKFEILNYIQNKTYMVTTLLLVAVIAVIMFLPSFIDMSELLGTESTDSSVTEETDGDDSAEEEELTNCLVYVKDGSFEDLSAFKLSIPDSKWTMAKSEKEVKQKIEDQKADIGFIVNSLTDYEYYIYNKDLMDTDMQVMMFENALTLIYRTQYCAEHNLDFEKLSAEFIDVQIQSHEEILGKDMSSSYFYCYVLVIVIFMIIILYCVMIATSVTTEKSNRSIEVLVTSTSPNNLIFGKVFAGTIASFLQLALLLLAAVGGYALNRDAWGNKLDNLLNIPSDVLLVFALFGIIGFIFYAFVYAAVGALVSKTEDLNKSASGVQMIIMIVYFLVLFQMSDIDGPIMKVLSFLPVSSYSAMYIRVAMGDVAMWEIIVSLILLILGTIGVGFLAAKIYRMGTLRYGNPISIRSALKSLKEKSAE